MQSASQTPQSQRFGPFEFDPRAGELRKQGLKLKIYGQPLDILEMLLARPGEVVTREELQKKLWPQDTFVDFEHSLNAAINRLRTALEDSSETPRFVETLPRRGYRFVAPVDGASPAQTLAAPALPARLPRPAVWMAVGIAAAVLATAGYIARERFRPVAQPTPGRVMLVVLPFENLSSDPEQEYFSDGLTEEMTTELGRLQPERLAVIARTSAMEYKKKGGDVRRIAGELGVDYVLEGSVRREGERVRITAQLIAARDQTHLWAESYDRDRAGILSLQREVARAIARQIELKLTPHQQARLARVRPINPEAHEAYLKGRYFFNKGPETLQKAAEYFQEAINKDPEYAPAYAGLADAYAWNVGQMLLPPREWYGRAKTSALKAVELDPTLAEAHASLAFINDLYDWDWDGALKEGQRAIALNPNYANAHSWYAIHLAGRGRFAEAEAEVKRAEELDPLNLFIKIQVGWIYLWEGQFDRAMAQWQKVIELDPNFSMAHYNLGMGYAAKGKYPEAVAAYRKALSLEDHAYYWGLLGHAHAMAGQKAEARKILAKLKERAQREYISPGSLALVHLALGEKDQALDLLEKAYRDRDPGLVNLTVEPFWWEPLHGEPRFQVVVRRMNFPPALLHRVNLTPG